MFRFVHNLAGQHHLVRLGVALHADRGIVLGQALQCRADLVVIRLDQGAWATLAHLQQGSIAVAVGMRAEIGTYIGRVGNSGRSTTPHLHLQVQESPDPDSPTVPFRLANFQSVTDGNPQSPLWNAACVPRSGNIVVAAVPNPTTYRVLASIIPGSAVWAVDVNGHVPRAFAIGDESKIIDVTIARDMQGRCRLETGDGRKLVYVSAPDAWRAIALDRKAKTFLKLLATGAPSIPYAVVQGMRWEDPVPVAPASWWGLMIAPYRRQQFTIASATCLEVPGVSSRVIEIETKLYGEAANAPHRICCTFEYQRGPVKIRADFAHASITFSLRSFVPREPIDA